MSPGASAAARRAQLVELSIVSLGVIDDAVLPLGPGFTAITGETGAGKTMVLTALGMLRGQRTDSGAIRHGAARAAAQGVWHVDAADIVDLVEEAGGVVEDGEVIVGRSVSAEGRSRAQIGGAAVPASTLALLAARLVAVHGQADQLRLRSAAAQRDALDAAAGDELPPLLAEYREHLAAWDAAATELDEITGARDARAAEAQLLRGELDDIAAVDPQIGEDDALAAQAQRLEHAESLRLAIGEAHASLSNDGDGPDAVSLVGSARRLVERSLADDDSLAGAHSMLLDVDALVAEASAELARYLDGIDAETGSLDEIQERRAALATVTRRFGSIEDALSHGEHGAVRLAVLDADDTRTGELEERIRATSEQAVRAADEITLLRTHAARSLERAVTAELHALAMPDARIEIEVVTTDAFAQHGRDEVRILLAPHPGAAARPVAKSASGGELSRVMLAIEVALASGDVPTLVFDEVDAGVGGAAAVEVGRRLKALAEHAQVIVVTHLAQVAAFADSHVRVVKDTEGGFTASSVAVVDGEERERELARMLAGRADSASAHEHARELLEDAHVR